MRRLDQVVVVQITFDLLFRYGIFVNDTANFSFTSNGLRKSIQGIVCFFELVVRNNGPRLAVWGAFKESFDRRSNSFERRNLEDTAIFLTDIQVKLFCIQAVAVFPFPELELCIQGEFLAILC